MFQQAKASHAFKDPSAKFGRMYAAMENLLRAVERLFAFLQRPALVKAGLKRFASKDLLLAGVSGAAASLKKQQQLGRARAFSHLLELPEDAVRLCLAFASPDELAGWSAVSPRWRRLAQHRALWTAHANALLAWLAQVGLLPPRDLSLTSSGRCRLGWTAAEFFVLRLGWRELAARVAFFCPLPAPISNTAAAAWPEEGVCWPRLRLVVAGALYDLTGFLHQHPGSPEILLSFGGCDGTRRFTEQRAHRGLYVQGNLPLWCLVPADARAPDEGCGVPPKVRDVWRGTRTCCDVRDCAGKTAAAAAANAAAAAAETVAAARGDSAALAVTTAEAAAEAAQRFWAHSRCCGGDSAAAAHPSCAHCGALACREQALFAL